MQEAFSLLEYTGTFWGGNSIARLAFRTKKKKPSSAHVGWSATPSPLLSLSLENMILMCSHLVPGAACLGTSGST